MNGNELTINLRDKAVLSARDLMQLGFSRSSAYQIMNRADMPLVPIAGNRKLLNARQFFDRLDEISVEYMQA